MLGVQTRMKMEMLVVVRKIMKTSSGWTQVGNTIAGATNGDKAGWGLAINDVGLLRVAVGSYNAHAGGTRNGLMIAEYNISTGNWDKMKSDYQWRIRKFIWYFNGHECGRGHRVCRRL